MHGTARGLHTPCLYDLLLFLMTRGRERLYREQLLRLARIEAGQRVLDIGCGTGTTALAAAQRVEPGGAVYGVDVSPKMIAAARRKAARLPEVALEFQVCDALTLPFSDAMFDTVFFTTVLHMIPQEERLAALRDASRVLRNGGRLLVVDYGGSERHGLIAKHHMHRTFELDSIRPLLAQAGLAVCDAGALGWLGLQYLTAQKA